MEFNGKTMTVIAQFTTAGSESVRAYIDENNVLVIERIYTTEE